jgi:hypothetical protein
METSQNVRVVQGSDVTITVVVTNEHGVEVVSALYTVRHSAMDRRPPVISKSLVHGIHINVCDKEITFKIGLDRSDTEGLEANGYHHEAVAVLADGAVVPLFSGELHIDRRPS